MSDMHKALLTNVLRVTFGAEWRSLSEQDRANVVSDYMDAVREDQCDSREYQRRIGEGNLQAYAECIRRHYQGETK